MIPQKNRTVTVKRLVQSGEKRVFSNVATGLRVYVNQIDEQPQEGFDGESSFMLHRMMTDGNHEAIAIGDRITDDLGRQFDVRGKSVHSSAF